MYRERAQKVAQENEKMKRIHKQVDIVRWKYIKEQKDLALKELRKKEQIKAMLKFYVGACTTKKVVLKVYNDLQKGIKLK